MVLFACDIMKAVIFISVCLGLLKVQVTLSGLWYDSIMADFEQASL